MHDDQQDVLLQRLLRWIRSHDCVNDARIIGGRIRVAGLVICRDGTRYNELHYVRTLPEARNWLGY